MKRDKWTFEHPAGSLATAAQVRLDHHRSRRAHWEEQKLLGLAKIREAGLEVSDGDDYPNMTSGIRVGRGPDVTVNAELKRRVTECHAKVQEHDTKMGQYAGWAQVLKAHPEQVVGLEWDDWLFFFGK